MDETRLAMPDFPHIKTNSFSSLPVSRVVVLSECRCSSFALLLCCVFRLRRAFTRARPTPHRPALLHFTFKYFLDRGIVGAAVPCRYSSILC
jgi:hypothetical protein